MTERPYSGIIRHYEACLEKYGDSHRGVDWPKAEDVERRQHVMMDVVRRQGDESVTLLDFGCGAAHLLEFIENRRMANIAYSGLDISAKFIALARSKFPQTQFFCVDILEAPSSVPQFDYAVMNGVFTERRDMSYDAMLQYWQTLLGAVFEKVRIGVAFNAMSKQVDWERDDLFHLPLDVMAGFVTKSLSRHFVVRNDYGLYEYTTYVYRKESPWRE